MEEAAISEGLKGANRGSGIKRKQNWLHHVHFVLKKN